MTERLFIANRGESACRVIRTAKRMGIYCIAACAEGDGGLHCDMADETMPVPDYLNAEALTAAAKSAGADMVHPGWGFLSENFAFAEMLGKSDIIFIGPSPEAMRRAADKAVARKLAGELGIPIIPGVENKDTKNWLKAAEGIGWPVLIKAAAGGGGRGMRTVACAKEFAAAWAQAQTEAQSAFGDSAMIIEKHIPRARHIEAQLLCDMHGTAHVVNLRDCTVQRRRQKIVEESPPPILPEQTATALREAALKLAHELGYCGAGTVEFLTTADEWFFMEINARLQVEHPVTELTCGLDLVEWQIRIARGESLPALSAPRGYAMEVRVCAENPLNQFLPSSGDAVCFFPDLPGVRADIGVRANETISGHYDSMLAKLIAFGDTRDEVRALLRAALAQTKITGVHNNTAFLRHLLNAPDFATANLWTEWADENIAQLAACLQTQRKQAAAAVAVWLLLSSPHPAAGLRLFDLPGGRVILRNDDDCWDIETTVHADNSCSVQTGNETIIFTAVEANKHGLHAAIGDEQIDIECKRTMRGADVFFTGLFMKLVTGALSIAELKQSDGAARAPMHAVVREVHVCAGQRVAVGDSLMLLEAMKIESAVTAPCAGVIAEVHYQTGDKVEQGAHLVRMEDEQKDEQENNNGDS